MSFLQTALEALNERYLEITDLIPNKYFFSDEPEDTSGPLRFGIDDGGGDMYDGANLIDTNLTQDWADVQDNDGAGIDSIPITHTPAGAEGEGDYTSPPMDGVVSDGTPYFGAGSEYFTNMYPALWVMMADMISVNQFSIWGGLGADGEGDQNHDSAPLLGGLYTLFYKSVFDADDPSINHMIIVPGSEAGITHNVPPGTDYDDHNLTGISDRGKIFYLLTAKDDDTELTLATAILVAEKFLEIVGTSGGGRLTEILPILQLRALAYDPLTFVSQLQPDSNIQNIIGQLESREIWLPYYDRPVRHGEVIELYGQRAIKARQVIQTMNSSGNAVAEILYYGSNPPVPVEPGGSIFMAGDESNQYMTVDASADWALGTGDFTIEWFQKMDVAASSGNARVFSVGVWPDADIAVSLEIGEDFFVWINGVQVDAGNQTFDGVWLHTAVVRESDELSVYMGGTRIHTETRNEDIANSEDQLYIGTQGDLDGKFGGLITNFHWVKGTALYSGASITVPTQPISPVANSKLLLLAMSDPTFVNDSSGQDLSVTMNGAGAWSEETPF